MPADRTYRLDWKPPEPRIGPPKRKPQSISPHFFLQECMRVLARQGIHGEPAEMNAATALEAAARLLLALGVT